MDPSAGVVRLNANLENEGIPMATAYTQAAHSGFRLLSDAQLDEIHMASLEILRRTGVRVHDAEAVALLGDSGCLVSDDNLVRFPAAVVEDALRAAPARVVLCDRTGEPRLHLEGERVYFCLLYTSPSPRDS